MRRTIIPLILVLTLTMIVPFSSGSSTATRGVFQWRSAARLILIVVMDGLRPDSINHDDTPTLFRLRQEGVNYVNSHSVFPTVTRVNAAAISTGHYPDVNGLMSNSMFVPAVHPNLPFNTGDYRELLKLRDATEGRLLFAPSLARDRPVARCC
jgi:predicted AlkP superfamily pyrophosphatase or phosphodiesterase